MSVERFNAAGLFLGRMLASALFVIYGWRKLFAYDATAAYMNKQGVPAGLLPLVIAVELGGGLLILAGFQTRIVALALAGFSIIAGLLFHLAVGDYNNMIHFWKNVAVAGGFLCLASSGAGAWSADAFLQRRRA